jgi:hypothetical protein
MSGSPFARRRTAGAVALILAVALLALPGPAHGAGRLLETGHDADWRCANAGTECHFIQVAVSYVRNGAPDPSRKLLVLDRAAMQMQTAILNAFGPAIAAQMQVVDPRSAEFATLPLTPAVYSAIVIASDQTCGNDASGFFHGNPNDPSGYCDLNRPPGDLNPDGTTWPPPPLAEPDALPDSEPIVARSQDIKAFFDAGGGVFVASGADDGDGHANDRYYAFLDLPGGAQGSACDPTGMSGECLGAQGDMALTPEGRAIGFTDGTSGTPDDIHCGAGGSGCASHNSFNPPRVGSQLLAAETGPRTFDTTLFEDLAAPDTHLTSGPGPTLATAAPSPPVPVVATGGAQFGFGASEDTTTFACQVDGGGFAPCASPASFSGFGLGVHRIDVRATDAAHNVDPTPAQASWLVSADEDGDRYLAVNPYGPVDCNDAKASIHPGASEVRGNRVDENCDGRIAPFQHVSATYTFLWSPGACSGCVRFTQLDATRVPRGAKVGVRCRGGGCGRGGSVRARRGGRVRLLALLHGRTLRPGAAVEVRVTLGRRIGDARQFLVRPKHGSPHVSVARRCVPVGSRRLRRHCPAIR